MEQSNAAAIRVATGGGQHVTAFARLPRESVWRTWVGMMANGDEGALASLYDETNPLVFGIALHFLRRREDAEEVTLDVFTQAWRSAKSFAVERGTVTAWLAMLTRSRAIDRLRANSSHSAQTLTLAEPSEIPSSDLGPEQAMALQQQGAIVREAVQHLSPEQRQAIELAFFSDLTHSEIAERLSQPLGTVKTRIRSGMMKLRDSIEGAAACCDI